MGQFIPTCAMAGLAEIAVVEPTNSAAATMALRNFKEEKTRDIVAPFCNVSN
jgi:hypothetical protein